jgi:maltooligosyltrehalose trehalohydrolase
MIPKLGATRALFPHSQLGATLQAGNACAFQLWAPFAKEVELHLVSPREERIRMERAERGYFQAVVEDVPAGALYFYRLNGGAGRPDPASRSQPQGVHGPSEAAPPHRVSDPAWRGVPIEDYILYELHVGTFTKEGTFDGAARELDRLVELGVTAVEMMPVAQFPGERNWGYDGVYPFAVQHSYGGAEGLARFVEACHARGMAVVLDVVYNHLGPEGNYLNEYGPYFTDGHKTPWGRAMNFDGPGSDEVRRYFLESALMWVRDFQIDALRLDAIHAIHDNSSTPFLTELAARVHEVGRREQRRVYLIPESDLNDARIVRSPEFGGLGMDAQWADDFHHAVHALVSGEVSGYYADFGSMRHLVKAYRDGFVYTGEYAPARERRHGNSTKLVAGHQLVVFVQNHDQVGNRMLGERLAHFVSFEAAKLAAGALFLAPYIPLLFMGEEYGDTAPFLYFVSHSDAPLVEAVRKGRQREFAAFLWRGEPPDPQAEDTFERSKLTPGLRESGRHAALYRLYRELIRLRKRVPALASLRRDAMEVTGYEKRRLVTVRRWAEGSEALGVLNLGPAGAECALPATPGRWKKLVDSSDRDLLGPGGGAAGPLESDGELRCRLNPQSFLLLELSPA